MPIRWILFKVVCILQMLASSVLGIMGTISLFQMPAIFYGMGVLCYVLIFLQTILAWNILHNNYPDIPVAGQQKTNFNRLFLLNFFFLLFLFAIVFSEYKDLRDIARLLGKSFSELPFTLFISLIANVGVLLLQLLMLYGLYFLRSELYENFRKKEVEFDFEKSQP